MLATAVIEPMHLVPQFSGPITDRINLPDVLSPAPAPQPGSAPSRGQAVAAGLLLGGLLVGSLLIGAAYNHWAYGDWTCLVKQCVQSSTKRR